MDIVSRAQQIILKPKDEWVKIKEEKTTIAELFTTYVFILAAVPAVANFVGSILFTRPYQRIGFGTSLVIGVLSYVMAIIVVYFFGIIINALAPTFSSKSDATASMKLAVYSMTPFWLAGVLYIFPQLSPLVFLAGIYGIYILYLGFDCPMMDTPKEKIFGYLAICIVVVVILFVLISMILGTMIIGGMVLGA